jgi:tetratricopeptide (TPR) repeat protein
VEHCAELGLTETCWDLAVSAHEFYTVRGHFDDWHATHRAALRACQEAGDLRGEGIVLVCLNQPALLSSRRTALDAGLPDLWRAASLLSECGDRHGLAIALRTLGNALRRQGNGSLSLSLFTEALEHYQASGDVVGQWQTQRYIGQSYLDRDDTRAARSALGSAEAIAVELGDSRVLAQTRYWTGQACLAADDIDGATAALATVWDVYCETTGLGRVYALHALGQLELRTGALGAAEQKLTAAAGLAADHGDAVIEGRVALSVAALRQAQRRPADRTAALEHAAAVFAGCGAVYLEVRTLAELARIAEQAGDAAGADALWDRIDDRYGPDGPPAEDRVRRHPAAGPDLTRDAAPRQRRAEGTGGSPAVQGRRPSGLWRPLGARGHDEAPSGGDLAVEVPRVKRHVPDHLVDTPQVADGELRRAEGGSQRGELQPAPRPLDGVVQDLAVVER